MTSFDLTAPLQINEVHKVNSVVSFLNVEANKDLAVNFSRQPSEDVEHGPHPVLFFADVVTLLHGANCNTSQYSRKGSADAPTR